MLKLKSGHVVHSACNNYCSISWCNERPSQRSNVCTIAYSTSPATCGDGRAPAQCARPGRLEQQGVVLVVCNSLAGQERKAQAQAEDCSHHRTCNKMFSTSCKSLAVDMNEEPAQNTQVNDTTKYLRDRSSPASVRPKGRAVGNAYAPACIESSASLQARLLRF